MNEKTINVLYVGHTLVGDTEATGKTLYQIFKDIKGIRFMQYCLDYDPGRHSNVCDTVYISEKKSKLYFQIKKYYRNDSNSTVNELVTGNAERKGNAFIAVAKAIMDSLHKEMGEESLKKIDDFVFSFEIQKISYDDIKNSNLPINIIRTIFLFIEEG